MPLAQNALTTLERLKKYLGIELSDTSQDFKLEFLINAASEEIETVVGRKLGKKNHIEYYTGTNRLTLMLKNYPVISINSIKENDELITEVYRVDSETAVVSKKTLWVKAGIYKGVTPNLYQGEENFEIDYVAGYVLPKDETEEDSRTLPYDLENAIIQMISGQFNISSQGGEGLKAFKISDVSWQWDKDYMQSVLSIVNRYRGVRI